MKYDDKNINPRLVAYCNAVGYQTLAEWKEKDHGTVVNFTAWNDKHWQEFDEEILEGWGYPWYTTEGEKYNNWLKAKYPES